MIHRHLDYPPATPSSQLGPAAIDDLLDRGDLDDWASLARGVATEPWGPLAETILRLCAAHPMYGTSALWTAYVASCRAATLGGGHTAWPIKPRTATLAQVAQRVCDSTGMVAFGNACPSLTVTCAFANGDTTVEVVYGFSLITASIVDGAFKVNPLPIHAAARFPVMTSGAPCAS